MGADVGGSVADERRRLDRTLAGRELPVHDAGVQHVRRQLSIHARDEHGVLVRDDCGRCSDLLVSGAAGLGPELLASPCVQDEDPALVGRQGDHTACDRRREFEQGLSGQRPGRIGRWSGKVDRRHVSGSCRPAAVLGTLQRGVEERDRHGGAPRSDAARIGSVTGADRLCEGRPRRQHRLTVCVGGDPCGNGLGLGVVRGHRGSRKRRAGVTVDHVDRQDRHGRGCLGVCRRLATATAASGQECRGADERQAGGATPPHGPPGSHAR